MSERAMRVGIGYDVHAFAPPEAGRPLMIGGIAIPHDRGLAGHSDADVLLHAVVDALLGAAALGDIGTYFPSSNARWQGASSADFLAHTVALLAEAGWRIENVDATVVMEAPRLGPHVPAIRATMAKTLQLSVDCVSVKGKTTDRLGFTGRSEGVACYAVALIWRPAMET
ncbi:MAG TPA: 2-C-methyl-D-erythritol 2,4-cyclodiphosphate synthase [Ktedonobacterales bacterium]|jgi:2-C-methyl-D-erythritol 2,4-cyclodiphosphate synthase|nr:2-C-methyl-D-erythritol 2,4-cyclodiphosphate synthase [Ktedonobacterales bacterium]